MSPWNRDALVSLRDKLQLCVLMETGLGNRLEEAAGGFMNEFEAATVREQSGNIQQMGKVIDILCGKGDKDFSTFLQMLRGSNNEVWAEELEKKVKKLKRKKGVCVQRGRRPLRDTVLNVFSAIEDHVLGTPLPSLQRCTALLHFETLIDLVCFHVLTYVHTYIHVVRFLVAQ